jgi:hypothetical protein
MITGPHGTNDRRDFFHIHERREDQNLFSQLIQDCYWRTQGYEIFGWCCAGYLLAWKI